VVHAAPPELDRSDPVLAQLPRGQRRRGERQAGVSMGGARHRPHGLFGDAQVVAAGETGEIGLIGSGDRHVESSGDATGFAPEHEGCGEVHDVGWNRSSVEAGPASVTATRHAR
jgi:hypothetical protein